MAFPARREHEFVLDGEKYKLVGWTRGMDRRIRLAFAMSIVAAPGVLDVIDGLDLYTEAVAQECLTEAPAVFWKTAPPEASQNGRPTRVATADDVPIELWEAFRAEVNIFTSLFRRAAPPVDVRPVEPGAGGSPPVEAPEAVPTRARMRAE